MADYLKPNAKVNARKNLYTDLDLFMTPHPVTKDVTTKKDSDAIKRSVKNIILTNKFERPFKPNFGASVRNMLFELNSGRKTKKFIKEIEKMIETMEPRVNNVRVSMNESDTNTLNLTVFYNIINGLSNQNVDFTVTRVR
jgi:phage baseplate assembly protein W